jgi:RNA polymerase sigma factor (TIGR02999 family)
MSTERARSPARDGASPSPPDRAAVDHLFSVAYEELRRLAASVRRNEAGSTHNPTARVNEAWLKLADASAAGATSRLHFKRIAARAMRQVLIDAARKRRTVKRGGGARVSVLFDESIDAMARDDEELLAVDAALEDLARLEPRQAMMVECRFFGGLDSAETAELLGVSEATVLRDWRAAKAWLARELRR